MHKKVFYSIAGALAATLVITAVPEVSQLANSVGIAADAYAEEIFQSGYFKYKLNANDEVLISDYTGISNKLVIPSEIDGKKVVGIGNKAFYKNKNIAEVILPETVSVLGEMSFSESSLTSIVIPSTVTTMYDRVFQRCGIESVEIHTDSVPGYTFSGCEKLKNIVLGDEVKSIRHYTFEYCENIESVQGGKNVTFIGEGALSHTPKLVQKFDFPNVEIIGFQAFYGSGLTEVVIPESLQYFTEASGYGGPFQGCKNLTKLIYNSDADIPEQAFWACSNLETVVINGNVRQIKKYAFRDCKKLTNFRFGGSETIIGECAFFDCDSLKNVILPSSLCYIGPNAFQDSGIVEMYIPSRARFGSRYESFYTFVSYDKLEKLVMGSTNLGKGKDFYIAYPVNLTMYGVEGDDAEKFASANKIAYNLINSIPVKSISFNYEQYNIKVGETIKFSPIVVPDNATEYVEFSSGDDKVLTIDVDGVAHAISEGTVAVSAKTKSGKEAICMVVVSLDTTTTEEISKPKDISLGYITAIPTQNYTGSAIIPDYRVMYNDTTILIPDVDYTATFSNNVNSGIATLTVTGKGRFEGTLTTSFYINQFNDVKLGQYYTDAILYLNDRAVMTGLNKTTFGFGKLLSREDMVVLLWKNEGKPSMNVTTNVFKDIAPKKYYTDAVSWAKKNNISSGYTSGAKAGYFGKGDTITRQDFIKIIYGYAKFKGYDTSVKSASSYTAKSDASKVSKYARESMNWAYEKGFIGNGAPLNPKGNIKRQDAAVIIARFLQAYDK